MAKKIYLVIRDEYENNMGFYFPRGVFIKPLENLADEGVFSRLDGKVVNEAEGPFRNDNYTQYFSGKTLARGTVEIFLPE